MFYDTLVNLCLEKNTNITRLLKELKLSSSKGTAWKNGSIPKSNVATKIANYFDVSVDYLLDNKQSTQKELPEVGQLSQKEIDLIKAYRGASEDGRRLADVALKSTKQE